MPYLELMVNVDVKDEKAFALEFSKLGAQTLGKPEAYITVSITVNKTLTFAGTFDPAFALTVTSLDNLNTEANEKYSADISSFLKAKLNIPNDRGYIVFNDPGRGFIGYSGTTFATIFAKS